MIVLDANLLIYAYHAGMPQHARAREWLERTLMQPDPVRLPWSSIHAFLRIITHPNLFPNPFSMQEATSAVEAWLAQPSVAIVEPGEQYWPILRRLAGMSQIRGNLVMDAHLATLTIEHGGVLCTTDKDFTRFENLRVVNPL